MAAKTRKMSFRWQYDNRDQDFLSFLMTTAKIATESARSTRLSTVKTICIPCTVFPFRCIIGSKIRGSTPKAALPASSILRFSLCARKKENCIHSSGKVLRRQAGRFFFCLFCRVPLSLLPCSLLPDSV